MILTTFMLRPTRLDVSLNIVLKSSTILAMTTISSANLKWVMYSTLMLMSTLDQSRTSETSTFAAVNSFGESDSKAAKGSSPILRLILWYFRTHISTLQGVRLLDIACWRDCSTAQISIDSKTFW